MIKLKVLLPTAALRGILPDALVTVVSVQWFVSEALKLTYKTPTGKVANELIYRHDKPRLDLVEQGRPWSFDGDGALFRLVSEAQRIRLAHLLDPVLAVHTSVVEPLPHQITAVYESMLPRQPLRFLLADDPGAGKKIMAGLLIYCTLPLRGKCMDIFRGVVGSPGRCPGLVCCAPTGQMHEHLFAPLSLSRRVVLGLCVAPFGAGSSRRDDLAIPPSRVRHRRTRLESGKRLNISQDLGDGPTTNVGRHGPRVEKRRARQNGQGRLLSDPDGLAVVRGDHPAPRFGDRQARRLAVGTEMRGVLHEERLLVRARRLARRQQTRVQVRRQVDRRSDERAWPSGIMLPNELNLGPHGVREVPDVAGGSENLIYLSGRQQVDHAAGVDDGWRWRASFPTHRVSPSRDCGKSILSVRFSPDGSTSWLVNVWATVSRAVAISHRRYDARSVSPSSPRSNAQTARYL
jgi:hypothetical protein